MKFNYESLKLNLRLNFTFKILYLNFLLYLRWLFFYFLFFIFILTKINQLIIIAVYFFNWILMSVSYDIVLMATNNIIEYKKEKGPIAWNVEHICPLLIKGENSKSPPTNTKQSQDREVGKAQPTLHMHFFCLSFISPPMIIART